MRLALLLGADDPENCAQSAWAGLFTRPATLRAPAAAMGYVRTSIVNACRTQHRRRLVARRHDTAPLTFASAEETAVANERDEAVRAALRRLRPRQRAVLVLRYYAGLSLAEISAELGMPVNTVKSVSARGLRALSEALEEKAWI